jgi:hypothetical protein
MGGKKGTIPIFGMNPFAMRMRTLNVRIAPASKNSRKENMSDRCHPGGDPERIGRQMARELLAVVPNTGTADIMKAMILKRGLLTCSELKSIVDHTMLYAFLLPPDALVWKRLRGL